MADWRPGADPATLRARAGLLAEVRGFMAARGVLEVETPVLSLAGNSDPAIAQVATRGAPARWMRSSPEYAMKRLLAAGSGDIYELGRVFRAGELGRHHNPEFTMLEWYRCGFGYRELAGETTSLVLACGARHGRDWTPRRFTYGELFERHLGLDPHTAGTPALRRAAQAQDIVYAQPDSLDHDGWLDLLMSHVVQPAMPADAVTEVLDYPASQAALARVRPGAPPVAERFEVFIGSQELANGYQELSDPAEQRRRFLAENDRRAREGAEVKPLDERLLAALEAGLPDCAGVALGFDRLLMACLGVDDIGRVLAFPADRA